jgi:hypothetical protein
MKNFVDPSFSKNKRIYISLKNKIFVCIKRVGHVMKLISKEDHIITPKGQENIGMTKNSSRRPLYPPHRCDGRYHHQALLIVESETNAKMLFHLHRSLETHRLTYEKYEPILDIDEANLTFIGMTRFTALDMDKYILTNINNVPFPSSGKIICALESCHDWSWLTAKILAMVSGTSVTCTNRVYLVNLSSQSPIQTMEHFVSFLWGF